MTEYKSGLPFFFLLQGPLQMPEHSWHVVGHLWAPEGETAPLPRQAEPSLFGWTYSREAQKGMLALKHMISPMKINGA